ncbi:hypothetical protein Tco_1375118, partial [Tanacetum coccineum]
VADALGMHDNWLYEGLSLDGPIDVGGQAQMCRFLKVHGKRVSVEVGKGRLGGLVALNDHEVDDDPQLKSQV